MTHHSQMHIRLMKGAMILSFVVGIFMLVLKSYAYFMTHSIAVLSDAAESVVHVFAVGFAAFSLWVSLKPADENHPYGHQKICFFSAGFEGAMILFASLFIFYEVGKKLYFGITISNVEEGVSAVLLATLINLFLGLFLMKVGKKGNSLILEANGKHILTDSWTSFSAILTLGLVKVTGITWLDPVVALFTGLNILITGLKLLKKSISGLMDETDPILHAQIKEIITRETQSLHLEFHHLRHRLMGDGIHLEFHILFPEDISLKVAHDHASHIEATLKKSLLIPVEIVTHLEPKENHDQIHSHYGLLI